MGDKGIPNRVVMQARFRRVRSIAGVARTTTIIVVAVVVVVAATIIGVAVLVSLNSSPCPCTLVSAGETFSLPTSSFYTQASQVRYTGDFTVQNGGTINTTVRLNNVTAEILVMTPADWNCWQGSGNPCGYVYEQSLSSDNTGTGCTYVGCCYDNPASVVASYSGTFGGGTYLAVIEMTGLYCLDSSVHFVTGLVVSGS